MADHSISIVAHKDVPKEKSLAEDEFLNLRSKQIPRFPSNLRRIGREKDYIAPRTVAIGPYYHGVPELEPMEEVKRTATNIFFRGLAAQSREATYEEIKSIASNVRCCYTDEDALEGVSDDKFAEIMFIDGCFLVQFIDTMIRGSGDIALRSIINPHINGILRDVMLFENQIPWAVMKVLMLLKSLTMKNITNFLVCPLHGLAHASTLAVDINKDYEPSHLLCLIRFYEASSKSTPPPLPSAKALANCTSAVELAEIGIKLEASRKMQLSAMDMVKGPCCAKLVLAPLYIDACVHCWLVNMAAFEMWAEISWHKECSINSYLLVLSLLMNREEDVRELRVKRIVHGPSSDRQTLEFFNDLAPDLDCGKAYWRLMFSLEEYKQKRCVWIAIYRFVNKHGKIIATMLPIVGVLVGIFKAILSLKQPPSHC